MCFFLIFQFYDSNYVLLYLFSFQYYNLFLDILIFIIFLIFPVTLLALFYFPAQFSSYRHCGFEIF
jgi:hypothetical protein